MIQSKAFDRLFMKVPNALFSSTFSIHNLSILNRQGSTLKPLREAILKSDKTSSKNAQTLFQFFLKKTRIAARWYKIRDHL